MRLDDILKHYTEYKSNLTIFALSEQKYQINNIRYIYLIWNTLFNSRKVVNRREYFILNNIAKKLTVR